MGKIIGSVVVGVTVIAVGTLTGDTFKAVLAGFGALLIVVLTGYFARRRTVLEVTSGELPVFIPGHLPRFEADKNRLTAIIDESEVLPPTPNMGQKGHPYRGPGYF